MLKPHELEKYKSRLLLLRAQLQGDVEQLTDEVLVFRANGGSSGNKTQMVDVQSDPFDQEFSLRMVENEQEVLEEIEDALERIESGVYGLCEGCQAADKPKSKSEIPKARLNVIPHARNCVECESRREEFLP